MNEKKLSSGLQKLINDSKTQPMGFLEYQELAMRTAPKTKDEAAMNHAALGLASEAGEVASLFQKWFHQGHEQPTKEIVEKELGDALWFIALLAEAYDTDLLMIAIKNIEKLRQRYPDGFSSEASINRVESAVMNAAA